MLTLMLMLKLMLKLMCVRGGFVGTIPLCSPRRSFCLSILLGGTARYMGAPTGVDAEAMRLQNEEYKKENEELRSKLQSLTEKVSGRGWWKERERERGINQSAVICTVLCRQCSCSPTALS